MKSDITRILLCMVLLTGIGTTAAVADNLFVITDGNGNYLANKSGSIANATSFDPKTCVWTCSGTSSGKLSNQGRYLYRYSYSLSLTTSSSSATSWTISGNKVYYSTSSWYSSTYYITYSSSSWTTSTSGGASIYSTSLTQTAESGSMTVEDNPSIEMKFEREGDTRDYYVSAVSYTPAYNTYTWTESGGTKTWYASTDDSYVSATAPSEVTTAAAYTWSSDYPDNVTVTQSTEEPSQATASYDTKFTSETIVTITATATIPQSASGFMTADATVSGTVTATLLSRLLADIQVAATKTTLYVGETSQLTVVTASDGTIGYTSSDNSVATVDNKGVITAKSTGDKDSQEVRITIATPQTDDYEATFTIIDIVVKKRPTSLTLEYDKSALTYGEAVPTLTASTLTDEVDGTEISGTVVYSSSDTGIDVNANTGELTVKKAATAVITAIYSGDNTHTAARATYTVTVSKAPTTLTFGQAGYLAQLSHPFTSPVATLTPSDAGEVTYSYTSTTAGLITLGNKTGKVTLNSLTGTATVTATFAGNDCYEPSTAHYVLTVSDKEIPNLVVTTEMEFYVDDTNTIHATTNSTAGITYGSSDPTVITVGTDGSLTAVGEGSAFIRITSVEDETYMEYSADYPITVKRYPTKVTASYTADVFYTDYENNILPTVSVHETKNNNLAETTGLISFSATPASVLTVDAATGQVTMVGNGTASITITYEGNRKYEPSTALFMMTIKKVAKPGTFIRLKDHSGNYLSSDGTDITAVSSTDASTIIWYGENRSLLFYQCGLYMKDAAPSLMQPVDAGQGGTQFKFTHIGDDYNISDNTTDLASGGSNLWTIEEVDFLPLTFKSAGHGFSTLYSPVDVTCPAGVVAYYPTARTVDTTGTVDFVISLKGLSGGYIPHNTPVVLHTDYINTYNFYIVEELDYDISDLWDGLAGTVPTITTSSVYSGTQCPYTLQPDKSSSAGFYPWDGTRHTTVEAFRCYIPGATASATKGFRFSFDDDTVDGIGNITPSTPQDAPYYNLQGIPMGNDFNALPSGVYIRGGQKIIKNNQ